MPTIVVIALVTATGMPARWPLRCATDPAAIPTTPGTTNHRAATAPTTPATTHAVAFAVGTCTPSASS